MIDGKEIKKKGKKMENNSSSSSNGIGFVGLLTIVFIVLKLTKVISWSWWWVLFPLWATVSIWVITIGVVIGIAYVAHRKEKTTVIINYKKWMNK